MLLSFVINFVYVVDPVWDPNIQKQKFACTEVFNFYNRLFLPPPPLPLYQP